MTHDTKYFRTLAFGMLFSGLISGCGLFEEDSLGNTPLIERFAAAPNPVAAGGSVMLRWEVRAAENVQIAPGIGLVPEKGFCEVRPASTTRYTLSARTGTSVWSTSIDVVVSGSSPASPTPTPTPSQTTPTPTPTLTTTPTPTQSPTPTPTPTTTQSPTPTPTPIPTSTQTPTPTSTETPYVPPHWSQLTCEEESPRFFRSVVIQAQQELKEEHPNWFDYETMEGWVIARDGERYFEAMIDKINTMDGGIYRAHTHFYEPESHIAVKTNNEFSEVFQIITSFNGLTNGYAFTCRPAEF